MALREFSSVKVGDELPEKTIKLTRQDLVNYAGVSGDLNPIHWDDEIAKQVGCNPGTVRSRLFYARQQMQAWLADLWE